MFKTIPGQVVVQGQPVLHETLSKRKEKERINGWKFQNEQCLVQSVHSVFVSYYLFIHFSSLYTHVFIEV